ncbi:DUF6350 family protein [Microbacterium sp. M3]|uniref:DUF6350 family protein n=2 Tax=Microbacterium arthrosphaerae TaxID=792652 RepID=A0ABU4H2H4_9MICO|nr:MULTISPECIES: DUF6350 family protein [Microbacterium]MDW4573533.1 DUF6350 family protein [Microbacterium arthrosphaerae]MDW7607388.1 DUF6350 family protein [Microbacterium sp. M3]
MHRLIVALLATVDAAIAAAVGLAATLAPLTLLWVFGFGGGADWGVLWPAGVAVWQLGNLVPLQITLPPDYLAVTGIDADAASFVLSLAPLAFAAFTAIFAARSGMRASRADAWLTGVLTSTAVFAALATGAALTAVNPVAHAETWQAILVPTLVFALPAFAAAFVTEWSEAGTGAVARLRDRAEARPHGWSEAPALIVRGTAVVVTGLIGVGAAVAAVALFARAGQIVALFQAGDVDALGASVLTLAQLAYVPTLAVWGMSFVAGPGFAVGAGTAVSPAGTQVGVVPGLPALGAVPDSTTTWLLLLALLPVALGALAGWIARSRLVGAGAPAAREGRMPQPARADDGARAPIDADRTAALSGLLAGARSSLDDADDVDDGDAGDPAADEPIAARLVITAGIAILSAGAAALLAFAASGSLGPGRLAEFGPQPGPVALAVGLEVLVGAAIVLLSPRATRRTAVVKAAAPGDDRDDVAMAPPAAAGAGGRDATEQPADQEEAARPVPEWLARLRAEDEGGDVEGSRDVDRAPAEAPTATLRDSSPEARTEPIDLPGHADR